MSHGNSSLRSGLRRAGKARRVVTLADEYIGIHFPCETGAGKKSVRASDISVSSKIRSRNKKTDVLIGKADWPPGIARPSEARACEG